MPASSTKEKEETTTTTERTVERKGHVTRVGNLGSDFELRFGANGRPYARASLAVETPKIAGDWAGERVVTWYDVTAFKSLAENAAISLKKGARVIVSGEAELEHWTDKENRPRVTKRILVDALGPELRFATCEVFKAERRGPAGAPASSDDGAPTGDQYEEEPF